MHLLRGLLKNSVQVRVQGRKGEKEIEELEEGVSRETDTGVDADTDTDSDVEAVVLKRKMKTKRKIEAKTELQTETKDDISNWPSISLFLPHVPHAHMGEGGKEEVEVWSVSESVYKSLIRLVSLISREVDAELIKISEMERRRAMANENTVPSPMINASSKAPSEKLLFVEELNHTAWFPVLLHKAAVQEVAAVGGARTIGRRPIGPGTGIGAGTGTGIGAGTRTGIGAGTGTGIGTGTGAGTGTFESSSSGSHQFFVAAPRQVMSREPRKTLHPSQPSCRGHCGPEINEQPALPLYTRDKLPLGPHCMYVPQELNSKDQQESMASYLHIQSSEDGWVRVQLLRWMSYRALEGSTGSTKHVLASIPLMRGLYQKVFHSLEDGSLDKYTTMSLRSIFENKAPLIWIPCSNEDIGREREVHTIHTIHTTHTRHTIHTIHTIYTIHTIHTIHAIHTITLYT